MKEIVYLNGSFVPRLEARIPAMDYGFLYGYGLFETMRAYNGRVFRLDSHLQRMATSARLLKIPFDGHVLENAVSKTIRINGLKDARVRLTVSIGEGSIVPDPQSCLNPTVLVAAAGYTPYPQETYNRGFRALVSSLRRNSLSPISAMKTTNYLESLLSREEARQAKVEEAILLNEKGEVAEASTSNVFLFSRSILKTPPLGSGILPGITRGIVLRLAAQLNIKVLEKAVLPEELAAADEAFLTNSVMEVMPLTALNSRPIGSGRPGALTGRLTSAYKDLVTSETG